MPSTQGSSSKNNQAQASRSASDANSRIDDVRKACLNLHIQVDEELLNRILREINSLVKERVERARRTEESRAWKEELEAHRFVRMLTELLRSRKTRRVSKPEDSNKDAEAEETPPITKSEMVSGSPPGDASQPAPHGVVPVSKNPTAVSPTDIRQMTGSDLLTPLSEPMGVEVTSAPQSPPAKATTGSAQAGVSGIGK